MKLYIITYRGADDDDKTEFFSNKKEAEKRRKELKKQEERDMNNYVNGFHEGVEGVCEQVGEHEIELTKKGVLRYLNIFNN